MYRRGTSTRAYNQTTAAPPPKQFDQTLEPIDFAHAEISFSYTDAQKQQQRPNKEEKMINENHTCDTAEY